MNRIWIMGQDRECLYLADSFQIEKCTNDDYGDLEGYVITTHLASDPQGVSTILGWYRTEEKAADELKRISDIIRYGTGAPLIEMEK